MSTARAEVPGSRAWWLRALGVAIPLAVVLLCAPGPFRWSLAAALVACAVLPLRHRWPWPVVVACVPALVGGLGWPAAMVSLYTVGRSTGRRLTTFPWAVLCCAAAVAPVFLTQHLRWPNMIMTVIAAGMYSMAPAVLGMLITTREQLEDSLNDLEVAREATLAAREEVARAAERDRIGREIHDAVGHHATMIAVGAAALAATSHDKQTRETAERLRVLAKRALAEMRAALGLLGTDSELSSGIAALPNLVLRARESGMNVKMTGEHTLGDDLPLGIERTVYRLVQESLTNAAKHARGADVEIRLERWATELRVTVTNGRPPRPSVLIPPGHGGGGLAGLAERLGMMGGRLRARPTAKGGFQVQGKLPTPPLNPDAVAPPLSPPTAPAAEPPPDSTPNPTPGDTKVATGEATNDGSATEGARAH